MMTIDTALLSAFVSAAVALLIVILKEFVLEPRRRRGIDKSLKRQLISSWISDMKSNVDLLRNHQRHLDKLAYDDRPLDRVALYRPELSKKMTDVRCQVKALNELVDQYNAVLAPQIRYLLMSDLSKAEPIPTQLLESGETHISALIKAWRDGFLDLIDTRRKELLAQIESLLALLEHTDEMDC